MITLHGTLTVRTIHGRNGDFNVGRLLTEIGEFSVKDPELDQYDEGRYKGTFGIELIYPTSYVAAGRMVMEVRARIGLWGLDGMDGLQPEDATPIQDPDPIEETAPSSAAATKEKSEPKNPHKEPAASAKPDEEPEPPQDGTADGKLAALFGELWPLGNEVKLDPTVDRARFRQQRDHLKASGYKFRPLDQIWVLERS
jgi:hypothetical protein